MIQAETQTVRRDPRLAARLSRGPIAGLLLGCVLGLGACASGSDRTSSPAPRIFDQALAGTKGSQGPVNPASTASLGQLREGQTVRGNDFDLSQRQIPRDAIADTLTVAQLRSFADRCNTAGGTSPPPDLDCSGLRLRVERLFRSDDEVARALGVLDRLGTTQNDPDDLRTRIFVERAIASGALDPTPPVPEPSPEEDPAIDGAPLLDAIISATGSR